MLNPGKHPARVKVTHWAETEPGLGQSAASRAAQRGRKIVAEMGISIEERRRA